MILFSIDTLDNVPDRPPIAGVWDDFMESIGNSLPKEDLESSVGERIFIEWAYNTLGIVITIRDEKITRIEVDDEHYTLLLLRYANNENIV